MDLALELGMTVAGLKASMTTSELGMWSVYARKKALPTRRLEFYLAQIAQVHAGGKLIDFLLFGKPEREPVVNTVGTVASALAVVAGGRKVHHVKRGT